MYIRPTLAILFLLFSLNFSFAQDYLNYASTKPVSTSWKTKNGQKITDGSLATGSLRENPKGKTAWIAIELTAEFKVGGMHLHLDKAGILPPRNFHFQYQQEGEWIDIPEIPYDLELKEQPAFQPQSHWVCVNQVAYNWGQPKGFTVPTAKSNLPFTIVEKESRKAVYKGQLVDGTLTQTAEYPASKFTHDQINVWLTAIAANWNADNQEESQAQYDYFRFYQK